MGLEPTTAAMARRYSSQLSYARTKGIVYIFYFFQEKIKNPLKELRGFDDSNSIVGDFLVYSYCLLV